jgi:uncharacterized membrane protein required for colicin V production
MIKTIDTVILVLLLFMTIKGIWRGFKKELISLVSYGIALLTATSQLDNGTRFFEKTFNFHPLLGYFAAYTCVFIVVILVVKFFLKNIMKIIQRKQSSGLLDSIGGMVFGFSLGMLMVGMFTNMMRPIPVMNSLFEQTHLSRFLPLSEKYAEPVVAKFMTNSMGKLPLDELLSKGTGENLILPGMMEGLLGDDLGALIRPEGMDIPDMGELQEQLQQFSQPQQASPPHPQAQPQQQSQTTVQPDVSSSALKQAMGILQSQSDTSGAGKSISDLLNMIKQ